MQCMHIYVYIVLRPGTYLYALVPGSVVLSGRARAPKLRARDAAPAASVTVLPSTVDHGEAGFHVHLAFHRRGESKRQAPQEE
jgi:hypothetical protein